jgi:hypothetical protein
LRRRDYRVHVHVPDPDHDTHRDFHDPDPRAPHAWALEQTLNPDLPLRRAM